MFSGVRQNLFNQQKGAANKGKLIFLYTIICSGIKYLYFIHKIFCNYTWIHNVK